MAVLFGGRSSRPPHLRSERLEASCEVAQRGRGADDPVAGQLAGPFGEVRGDLGWPGGGGATQQTLLRSFVDHNNVELRQTRSLKTMRL